MSTEFWIETNIANCWSRCSPYLSLAIKRKKNCKKDAKKWPKVL